MPRIDLLGNLNSKGGGEQSLCTLAHTFQNAGWDVGLYPWGSVNEKYRNNGLPIMEGDTRTNVPLLFYANDRTGEFCGTGQKYVNRCSDLVIGINYVNRPIPQCKWLAEEPKFRAIIFQNQEKREEFDRDAVGFGHVKRIVLHGAIDLDSFLDIPIQHREEGSPLVVLKHCGADERKYVTKKTEHQGAKVHVWQQHLSKETDIKFYGRLLKDCPNTRFEFMEAHPEVRDAFRNEPRMAFHKWDAMPVREFLGRGHVYLYRTSNAWRDQYPRVVAEALAAGLPVLTEPRDGTKDRVQHGDTGFHCVDYDGFRYGLRLLERKEEYRYSMGENARSWAAKNLNPERWVDAIGELIRA